VSIYFGKPDPEEKENLRKMTVEQLRILLDEELKALEEVRSYDYYEDQGRQINATKCYIRLIREVLFEKSADDKGTLHNNVNFGYNDSEVKAQLRRLTSEQLRIILGEELQALDEIRNYDYYEDQGRQINVTQRNIRLIRGVLFEKLRGS